MFLFSEEKTIAHKVANVILLLWMLGALIFMITSIVDHLYFTHEVDREVTLPEYTRYYCYDHVEKPTIEACKEFWELEKDSIEDRWYSGGYNYELFTAISAAINFVIVTAALVIINIPKKKKSKTAKKK